MIRLKKPKPGFFEKIIAENKLLSISDRQQGMDFLIELFAEIRPAFGKQKKNPEQNLLRAVAAIQENKLVLANVQHAFLSQLVRTKLTTAITESGIPLARNFWQEFFTRLRHKLLPPLPG